MAEAVQEPQDSEQTEGMEGGSYEVIRRRLIEQSQRLSVSVEQIDEQRKLKFGSTELVSIGNKQILTKNNCIPVDLSLIHI